LDIEVFYPSVTYGVIERAIEFFSKSMEEKEKNKSVNASRQLHLQWATLCSDLSISTMNTTAKKKSKTTKG
jgi:hypothetical protein